jgi:two-component system phosphate regulon response regulator PhoB
MNRVVQVVEDDPNIRFIVEYILKDASYMVQTFANAWSFLNRSKEQSVDLVILDVMLPDGNGIDLSKKLKTDSVTCHIPVLIMSAHCSSIIAFQDGKADEFIQKPFDLNTFIFKVDEIVKRRPNNLI